jgi:hypothetical protein
VKGDSIQDAHHVLRHVKARFIQGDDVDGSAFRLRKTEQSTEQSLSFNWMEYYQNQTPANQLQLIRETFPLKCKRNELFVKLNVGSAKRYVASEHSQGTTIDFFEDGDNDVPSHCLMTGRPEIDDLVGDLLVECILEKFPAMV